MRKILIVLAFMILSALPTMAQIDLHSHAITKGYLDYIIANGAEMDEGFSIPAWDAEQHIAFMDKAGIQTAVLTMPEQLGQAVADLGARRFVTVHHSKFCLSNHPWDEPRKNERKAAEQYGLQLVTCQIGELFLI